MQTESVLTFQNVDISYAGKAVVHDVSFFVRPGEILGIVGESGSGKSSLLRAAIGLLGADGLVTRGDIFFDGKNLPDLPEKELQNIRGTWIGMVFQDAKSSFCPTRTIGAQITESMRAQNERPAGDPGTGIRVHARISRKEAQLRAKEQALELFEKLRLADGKRVWDSYPFELSGGMCQRAAIASAMLLNPCVLLADEPTSALDTVVQREVIAEMLRVRELFGTAILLVTHNIGAAAAAADRILVLRDGRVCEYGNTRQVLQNPQSEYTRRLLFAVPQLKQPAQP